MTNEKKMIKESISVKQHKRPGLKLEENIIESPGLLGQYSSKPQTPL